MAGIRYIVDNVDEAVEFYRSALGFEVKMHKPGQFAALSREDLTLFLNRPGAGSAGQAGGSPTPGGGWNRFQVVTTDLDATIDHLRDHNVQFRGDIATAAAGRQILAQDPDGNLIELFEHAK